MPGADFFLRSWPTPTQPRSAPTFHARRAARHARCQVRGPCLPAPSHLLLAALAACAATLAACTGQTVSGTGGSPSRPRRTPHPPRPLLLPPGRNPFPAPARSPAGRSADRLRALRGHAPPLRPPPARAAPRTTTCSLGGGPPADQCAKDSDCTGGPHDYCGKQFLPPVEAYCGCSRLSERRRLLAGLDLPVRGSRGPVRVGLLQERRRLRRRHGLRRVPHGALGLPGQDRLRLPDARRHLRRGRGLSEPRRLHL